MEKDIFKRDRRPEKPAERPSYDRWKYGNAIVARSRDVIIPRGDKVFLLSPTLIEDGESEDSASEE